MKALIDGDILVYRGGYASQKTLYRFVDINGNKTEFPGLKKREVLLELKRLNLTPKDGNLHKLVIPEPIEFACHTVKMMVKDIMESTGADELKMYLTSNDGSNYRFDIAKTKVYKGNRKQPKPIHYEAIREYLTNFWGAVTIVGREADDEMGIDQCEMEDTIICTIDKDLDMIPGDHYNFVTRERYTVSDPGELELKNNRRKLTGGGLIWFYAQMLLGDSADNIPGLPKYGPVKAYETLHTSIDEEDMARRVLNAYTKTLGELDASRQMLEVADLLWIQRDPKEFKSKYLEKLL